MVGLALLEGDGWRSKVGGGWIRRGGPNMDLDVILGIEDWETLGNAGPRRYVPKLKKGRGAR